jgi:hypothetical protein
MTAEVQSADVPHKPRRVPTRVTSGRDLLPDIDGRTVWARRCRDLVELHLADKGGEVNVSEGERAIIRRAAVLIVELERQEAAFAAAGGAPDIASLDAYQRASNSLRRLLEAVGLERRGRDVTPTLSAYLATKAAAPAVSPEPSPPSTHGGGSE